ncbi:hypothetical protein D3C86_1490980 [compost metagenome]
MVSQSSRSHLGAGSTPRASPALLINPRSLAKDGGRLAIASSMALRSRTSSTRPWTSVCFDSSAHNALRRSSRRPVSTSFQPASAKRRAQASPKPEVAPVINRVLDIVFSLLRLMLSHGNRKSAGSMPGLAHSGNHRTTCTKNDQTTQHLTLRGLQPCARTLSTAPSTHSGGKWKS